MKRVLGVSCGTVNGNNEALLKEAMKAISANCEAECVIVRLQEMLIKPCIGCQACIYTKLNGNYDFRCSTPVSKEHMYAFEQECRKADAIIFSAPIYNMMPPGQLITLMNKLHATADYRFMVAENPKIGACMGTGGSDWVNYMQPLMGYIAQEYVGGYHRLVDNFAQGYCASVFLDDDLMARAYKLGENVADALNTGDTKWRGGDGLCPICHENLIEQRADGYFCPTCDVKFNVEIRDEKPVFVADAKSMAEHRFSPAGMETHFGILAMGGMKQQEGMETIKAGHAKYDGNDLVVRFPPIE